MESPDSQLIVPPPPADETTRRFDREAIGFLSSLVAHLVLLLVMALIVQSPVSTSTPMVVHLDEMTSIGEGLEVLNLSDVELSVTDAASDQAVAIPDLQFSQRVDESRFLPESLQASRTNTANKQSETPQPESGEPRPPEQTKDGVRFFDTHAYGTKFVYVLDISGSMLAGQGRRMRRAYNELIRSINELQPHHTFEVVLYNSRTYTLETPKLHLATSETKQRFELWMSRIFPRGGTMPGDALRIAGDLEPDAIFFLSDGEFVFTAAATPEEDLNAFLQSFAGARPGVFQNPQAMNKLPKAILDNFSPEIVVHTIAFESRESRALMEKIAKEKGGQFQFIPPPARPAMRRR